MTDRELLELAAKAAGIEIKRKEVVRSRIAEFGTIKHTKHCGFYVGSKEWNPLTDDGDALRLAVKLGFLIEVNYGEDNQKVIVWDYTDDERRTYEYWGDTTGATCADPYAATRRAIVRAAAEIGKAQQC